MTAETDWREHAARWFEPRPRRYPSPGALARALDPLTADSAPLQLIDRELVRIADRLVPADALAVFCPPQEGKSQRVSRRLPEWLLEHDPTLRIAIVSYDGEMAVRWGRQIKRDIAHADPRTMNIRIMADSSAAGRWDTPEGGGLICTGIGGPLSGRPVDVLIIDDPVKDREAAESQALRERAWEWWESVAMPRLASPPVVCLMMCMTGDTPVLMGDGAEKPLRDIRPGDTVATYENGQVTTATVRNWANQGPDSVYAIRMKSGTVVRANARHPFLTIQDGVETWQRTDKLRPGSRILRVTGASGTGSPARAASPPDAQAATARGCACPATASSDGPTGTGRHRSTPPPAAKPASDTATASAPQTMTGSSPSKAAAARSANGPTASPPTGTRRSASTMTMTPGESAGCCATTATSSSVTPRQKQPSGSPLTTCAIEADEVVEIVPCGTEDVYDLQIDRTENFIANGLVSHNTRWHQDDLAGRILSRPSPLRWRVLSMPAIAEDNDPLGRDPGQEFPSVRGRPPGYFANIRAGTSVYVFAGIYQQRPGAAEGNFFRRATFRYWRRPAGGADPGAVLASGVLAGAWLELEGRRVDLADPAVWKFATVDVAASTRTSADWTVVSVWAIDREGDLILLDRRRGHAEMSDHFAMARPLREKWRFDVLYVERQFYSQTLVIDARAAGVPVAEVSADTDKVTRAIPAAGRVHAGRVWFPAQTSGCTCGDCGPSGAWLEEWESEIALFPKGTHDDQVDTMSYAARIAAAHWVPPAPPARPPAPPKGLAQIQAAFDAATGNGSAGPPDLMSMPLG